jgi:glycosyltransferase involved in cell wall biosynthesis
VITLAAIVTNHNYGAFVAQALDSLLGQRPAFDLVVAVDDGSTDRSREVLASYADRVVVVEQPNAGQLAACLAGLRACTADYVYFLDADDLALPGLVEHVRPHLGARPVKLQFQLRGIDADAAPLGSVFPTFPAAYDADAMVADNARAGFYVCPPTSGNVYHRETLLGLGLDALDPHEAIDGVPTLVLPYLGPVVSLPRPLAAYRVHGANKSLSSAEGDPTADLVVGGQDAHSVERLAYEIERFEQRWASACELIGLDRPPFDDDLSDYVLERRLMAAAQGGPGSRVALGARYVRRVLGSSAPLTHRLAIAAWTLAVMGAGQRQRQRLVAMRRSAADRPDALRRWVRLFQRSG